MSQRTKLISDLNAFDVRLHNRLKAFVQDGSSEKSDRALAAVPLTYQDRTMGVLMVSSDGPSRVWQDNEILLMHTVADQVAVAVNHARLFSQFTEQALKDDLTGCYNRRAFEIQLERDLHIAKRRLWPVALTILDIDYLKRINQTFGPKAGDAVLKSVAEALSEELRAVDTAARYGSADFTLILPQANLEGAMIVAESIRARIENLNIAKVGPITASIGVAAFPISAGSHDLLVEAANRALYYAKRTGRNRVCSTDDLPSGAIIEVGDTQ